ncbi:MAG TPA: DUF4126 domain-containing protein [Pirellulales bacterium]|nr:DUF4126 domain-containing protein [Pirellulales bacterium]
MFESLIGAIVGIGLAASCGFRVFVPMLVMSIAAKAGQLELTDGWGWIGSWPAIVCFGVATLVEFGGYCIPWLDNLLDAAASPAAVIAGTIATAACVSEMSPWLQWSTAIIAGGGAAGLVQSLTVAVRGTSTATTGGLGNPIVAAVEFVSSAVLSVLAIIAPILAVLLLCVVAYLLIRRFTRRKRRLASTSSRVGIPAGRADSGGGG